MRFLKAQQKYYDILQKIIQRSINASCTIYVMSGKKSWIGSGFHIGHGYIATASHVVPPEMMNSAYEIILDFDGKKYPAQVLISEPNYDSAILFSNNIAGTIPSVVLGDSSTVEIGDLCAVISSPEGMGRTAVKGSVANIHQGLGEYAPTKAWTNGLIIIDASILEGSSGGMCLTSDGKVIGSVKSKNKVIHVISSSIHFYIVIHKKNYLSFKLFCIHRTYFIINCFLFYFLHFILFQINFNFYQF
jgi:S1-C subfamily serine protease